jgi:glucose/arabinose dehydrogenase
VRYLKAYLAGLIVLLFASNNSAQFELINAYPGAVFSASNPVDYQHAGDGTNRVFVVEQGGIIRAFPNVSTITSASTFLDITDSITSGGELGLLGLAFHPNYANNGYYFVNYTTGTTQNQTLRTVIARYQVSSEKPDSTDQNTKLVLMEISQPASNHNGGQIAFGPDGYLYIAVGDGGSQNDPNNYAQTKSSWLGKILRIDVDNTEDTLNYSIPSDNPFKDNSDGYKEEIYASGLRNPWRFSFDPATELLWCADVGQSHWEEINIIENGKNYGWRCREGFHPNPNITPCSDTTEFADPIHEYGHNSEGGFSVTGGYVYRGNSIPELYGKYIYADYVTRRIWALEYDGINPPINTYLFNAPAGILSFGLDAENELYVLCSNGRVYKFSAIPNLSAPTNLIALPLI